MTTTTLTAADRLKKDQRAERRALLHAIMKLNQALDASERMTHWQTPSDVTVETAPERVDLIKQALRVMHDARHLAKDTRNWER